MYILPILDIYNNAREPSAFSVTVYGIFIFAEPISSLIGITFIISTLIDDGPIKSLVYTFLSGISL